MSKKVDARGMRAGITKDWKATWFAEDDMYSKYLLEDDAIRKYIAKLLRGAGIDEILIERSIKAVKITIRVSRPGIVIGKKGSGLMTMRLGLSKLTKSDIELQIEEMKLPNMSANIVAETIALQLEKRISARRAMNVAAERAMESGAMGVRIEIAGTIQGPNSIAGQEMVSKGAVPTQTLRADIDFAKAVSYTRGGTIGIKVWINKGEISS
ncbi:MAG: small subunit ribosomal protein [Patescibacteria group bacterium]|nr:small subunit ribosomal protein [Patescibacteria group bacterium]